MKNVKLFLSILLALSAAPAFAIDTGAANQVYVIPSTGGRAKFGQVDLAQSAAVKNQLPVTKGGTGLATATAHGLVLGEGTSAFVVSAAGSSGQCFLSGGASADGAYGALDVSTAAVTGVLKSSNGGTGAALSTQYGVVYGATSTTLAETGTGTTGQYLGFNTGSAPTPTTFTAPTQQRFTSTGTTAGYVFIVTSANATVGATFTNNSHTFTVLSTIASGTVLFTSGTLAPTATGTLTKSGGTGDATITFSAAQALAVYTTPTSPRAPLYLRVKMVGGGGGGYGTAVGQPGLATYFGSPLLTANGGLGGNLGVSATQAGGTASIVSPAYGTAVTGGSSQASNGAGSGNNAGGGGGDSCYGGGTGSAGGGNPAPYGSGGGGAWNTTTSGGGGSAGGCVDNAFVPSPSASYYYAVGVHGAKGTGGNSPADGIDGYIEVTEFYQ